MKSSAKLICINVILHGKNQPIRNLVKLEKMLVGLIVEDHGIGIKEDALDNIFDRFERSVNEREIKGLGLGLFITKQIVTAHGG